MNIIQKPTPNFSNRMPGSKITAIIIHSTQGSAASCIAWFGSANSQVSAHYLVDKLGTVYQFVPDYKKAWHAGTSVWNGIQNANNYSIGIELENLGAEPYPDRQIEVLAELVNEKRANYGVKLRDIVAHAQISPGRKTDPGILFPWAWFGGLLQVTPDKIK